MDTNATSLEAGTAAVDTSFDQGVEDIAALLVDPETDLPEDDGSTAETVEAEAETETADAETAQDDGPEEVAAGGKFVSRDAKVRLDDGTVISVGDLARNNLYQRDYTRKTEELKAERESFKAERSQSSEIAQALAAQRDFLLAVAPKLLPAPPDRALRDPQSPQYDPLRYQAEKEDYEERVRLINQIYHQEQAERSRRGEETAAEKAERQRTEAGKLLEAIPEFKDRRVYESFMADASDVVLNEYGYTEAEFKSALGDHRYYKVMKDLVLLSKARKKPKDQVQKQVQSKPGLMRGGARMDPKAKTSRDAQQRREQLRSTGDFDAGVSLIESLL